MTIANLKKMKTLQKDKNSSINKKKVELSAKDTEILVLKQNIVQLEKDLLDSSNSIQRLQRMNSYYKNLPTNTKLKCSEACRKYQKLNSYVTVLETHLGI